MAIRGTMTTLWRNPRWIAAAVLALLASAAQAERPNVVLIFGDDWGYGNVGCYGAEPPVRTPNIDRLAAEGVRMTEGYVTASLCFPSRVGLMSGQYPSRFGIYSTNNAWYNDGVPRDLTFLAEPLQESGYATAIIGKWHLSDGEGQHPLDRGFDYYYGIDHCCPDYFDPEGLLYRNHTRLDAEKEPYLTEAFTREAIEFIERSKERPFFLYLPYNAVHGPRQAPPETIEKFDTGSRSKDTFFAMIQCADDGIGRVMAKVREIGEAENTLVFFLTDNGGTRGMPGPNNSPLRGWKRTMWEGGLRIPFIVRWPGKLPAGTVHRQPVLSLDIYPTVLAAAGVEPPEGHHLDGENMLPALRGERDGPLHEAIAWGGAHHTPESNPHYHEKAGHAEAPYAWAVRRGPWRMIDPGDGPRLYHLGRDIGEENDVIAEHPEVAEQMKRAYLDWSSEMDEPQNWPEQYWKGRMQPKGLDSND